MELEHVWSGLIGIKPLYDDTCGPEECGAWVGTVAKARSHEDFLQVVTHFYKEMEFEVFDVEAVGLAAEQARAGKLGPDLLEKARQLRAFGEVGFDKQHDFPRKFAHG